MRQIEKTEMKQTKVTHSFKERLIERKTSLREPITRNKLSFFETPAKKKSSKAQQQLPSMKSDCSLFSRLFIACQKWIGLVFLTWKSSLLPVSCWRWAFAPSSTEIQPSIFSSVTYHSAERGPSELRSNREGWSCPGEHDKAFCWRQNVCRARI